MLSLPYPYLIIVIYFYTTPISGQEILNLKVSEFATKVVSPQTVCKILHWYVLDINENVWPHHFSVFQYILH